MLDRDTVLEGLFRDLLPGDRYFEGAEKIGHILVPGGISFSENVG